MCISLYGACVYEVTCNINFAYNYVCVHVGVIVCDGSLMQFVKVCAHACIMFIIYFT